MQPAKAHATWIAHKVQATLSHYPQNWSDPEEVKEMALDDWIDALGEFSQRSIEAALSQHMRNSRLRPTPGEIVKAAREAERDGTAKFGDRSELTRDELVLLETKVLPTARRWVAENAPSHALHQHGKNTLMHWREMEGQA